MNTDMSLGLADGRRLCYAEYGAADGHPLVFCHGFPGSRFELMPLDAVFSRLGLRVLVPDRPGMGRSTYRRDFSLLAWPGDVVELADSLGLGVFSMAGASGGGPFCLACAFKIPARLASVSIIAGLGPATAPEDVAGMMEKNAAAMRMAREQPWKVRLIYSFVRFVNLEKARERSLARMGEADRRVMEKPEMRAMARADAKAAAAQGGRGLAQHAIIYANDWGFDLGSIEPKVDVWHGEADANVPIAMGRYQAERLRLSSFHPIPGEGHFSLPFNHAEEIFGAAKP